jgi:RNA-directed DNA polymerase
MTKIRQKSDGRIVAKGLGNKVRTPRDERATGAKASMVNEETAQLTLQFVAAEKTKRLVANGGAVSGKPDTATRDVQRTKHKRHNEQYATMESVTERLSEAFEKVARNQGAAGPDGVSISDVRKHVADIVQRLTAALLDGNYQPGDVRRVWISKSNGSQRGLGIPNVVDRMVQEAVRQVLEPMYEPTFHESSHGFRPGRSCQTAIAAAVEHMEQGYPWVVDMDVEKFFDRVHHQRLMARLSVRITDKRILVLIGKMLKAKVVMTDGVVVATEQGVPQGGPLSPLLSNIVLDELDWELAQRGHRFVRYADDCNVYVRSERAGQRVMASIKTFIKRRLRLTVNEEKSAVARPEERHFVGFRLRREPKDGSVDVLLSKRSKDRIDDKIRVLTPRNWGSSIVQCIKGVNSYVNGWVQFFSICTHGVERVLESLDAHIRRRMRAIQLKQWKRKRTIAQELVKRGVKRQTAWQRIYEDRKSFWRLSHAAVVERALPNRHWSASGLISLRQRWQTLRANIGAPAQLTLVWNTSRS